MSSQVSNEIKDMYHDKELYYAGARPEMLKYLPADAKNVLDVGYERDSIASAVQHFIHSGRPNPSHVYGGGDAGKQIATLLAELPQVFHKTIEY